MPSITCEKCLHQQSQETTDEAVLASLMVLHAYFLAILDDLETQYWTIRSWDVGIVVCVLGAGTFLGTIGVGFWVICIALPWVLGCWLLWTCIRRIIKNFIVGLTDNPEAEEQGDATSKLDIEDAASPSK